MVIPPKALLAETPPTLAAPPAAAEVSAKRFIITVTEPVRTTMMRYRTTKIPAIARCIGTNRTMKLRACMSFFSRRRVCSSIDEPTTDPIASGGPPRVTVSR